MVPSPPLAPSTMEPCGFAIDDMSINERALFSSDTNAPGRDSSSPPSTSSSTSSSSPASAASISPAS